MSYYVILSPYFWLKPRMFYEKVSVMANHTLTRAASFINIYVLKASILSLSNIYSTSYPTFIQHFSTSMNLRKPEDSVCCRHWKQI